jgi:hypothetical protein
MLIGTLGLSLVGVALRKIARKKGEATESGKGAMMLMIGILCGVLAPILLFLFLFRGSIVLGW